MTDTPAVTHNPERQRYSLMIDGVEAYLTYKRPKDGHVKITHTIVPKAIGGRGLGKHLVARIMADIIAADETVSSSCWYATAKIDDNPDWAARLK
ncbi:MAG: GNAT family N-acetyltransferase [Hyphomonas sp.]